MSKYRFENSIPVLAAGMLFFFASASAATASALHLALELAAQGDTRAARTEALRAVHADPDDTGALLLAIELTFELNPLDLAARQVAIHIADTSESSELRARAAYLAGQSFWRAKDLESAWSRFAAAFRSAESRELFLCSGCALFLLRREQNRLGLDDPPLLQQLESCRNLWTSALQAEVRPQSSKRTRGGPAAWIVSFYRAQIGPAIGHRCSLDPSCSEYFLQASRRHGWMGIPLIGDRLVREPGVVQAAEEPVERRGMIRFRDPVEAHTYWFDP